MAENSIAKAYVQVVPTTRGIKGSLSGIFGSEGSSAGSIFGGNMVSMIKNTVAAAGLGTLIKEALSEGADKQQSLGGIETLFKENADMVIQAAENAYKTAGMSANDYMETVTSFSASLLQGLSGDTQAAAEVADMALTDMSDNANKMGTSMELIQNAYQGFAKQNYTMLDNLKLGYGGTKSEMERLLADAQKLTGVKYDISNLADVYEAIHVIQTEMGITGTTALEASSTFSGSLSAMKAAASNVMASLTLGEDIRPALSALSETVFTFIGGNLLPMVGNLISGLPTVISESISMAVRGMSIAAENADEILEQGIAFAIELGSAIITGVPYLIEAGLNLAGSIGQSILDFDWAGTISDLLTEVQSDIGVMAAEIFGTDGSIIESVVTGVRVHLPALLDEGIAIVTEVATGILENLPEAVSAAGDLVGVVLDLLAANLPAMLDAGVDLVLSLVGGVIDALPDVASSALEVCAEFLVSVAGKLPEFLESGITIIGELAAGLIEAIPDVLMAAGEILADIGEKFMEYDWLQLGMDILQGIANGIINGASAIVRAARDAAKSALDSAKEFLGIHSPSRRFQDEVGAQIPPGIAVGVEKNSTVVKSAMAELSDYASDSFHADFSIGSTAMEFNRTFAYGGGFGTDTLENLLREQRDINLQSVERLIVLLEMLLEAVLGIEISGEAITRLTEDYKRKIAVVEGG